MKRLRQLHVVTGMIFAPFLAITGITGVLILVFDRFWEILPVHSWFRWGGVFVGLGLILLIITGAAVRIKGVIDSRKQKLTRG
ncbi:MAG: hypothetical protein ABIK22_01415 [candidate division WOR-3 bacterium]